MKFTLRYDHSGIIKGGSADIDPVNKHESPFIDVYGHYTTPKETEEFAKRLHKFVNKDFTSWDYLKMAFSKLLQEINERRNLWKQ